MRVEYARLKESPQAAVRQALSGSARGIAVETSGSTGRPREVLISAGAMAASAQATHSRLGGPGQWLLAVPADRVAGAMVIARAHLAGTDLMRIAAGPFTARSFADAVAGMDSSARRYVSLVPTQLVRVMDSARGRETLTQLDAVLVGGAALPAGDLPANVVATYGASETSGGCVYNGVPLEGTSVAVVDGVIRLAGPTLADGYADGDNSRFVEHEGTRWFVTNDEGELGPDGRLRMLGRVDDVITSGGVKFHPGPIEAAVRTLPWVGEAVAVGVPDPEWGERIEALVETKPGMAAAPWAEAREALASVLDRAALPKRCMVVEALPRLASGKIDRARARQLVKESHA